ncbi:MAG: hypothetical protein ACR2RV_07180 [Verrucomicrobiales bacterium]
MKASLTLQKHRRRQNGSALLVCLMVMLVTTVGVASWLAIINGRTAYTEAVEDGMRRRVALENSRSIAEEYMYGVAATLDAAPAASFPVDPDAVPNPNPPVDADQPDIVEQVEIAANTAGPLEETSVDPISRVNRLGMAEGTDCYQTFYNVALGRGSNQRIRRFELRGRSPILYGDLVTLHQPTITPGNTASPDIRFRGNVNVKGRTVFWRPDMIDYDSDSLYASNEYVLKSAGYGDLPTYNSVGDRLRPSNFPFKPVSAGSTSTGSLGFDGELSTVENAANPINTMFERIGGVGGSVGRVEANGDVISSERGVVSNGSGSISIDLSESSLSKIYINNNTRTITLNGQADDTAFAAAADLQPVVLVIIQDGSTSRDLDTIELTHRNSRRLIVAVKTTIDFGQSATRLRATFRWMNSNASPRPTWRLIAIAENTEIRFQHDADNSHATIYGGIRTDRGFYSDNVDTKSFTIERETDPGDVVTALLDRNVWLESYNPD